MLKSVVKFARVRIIATCFALVFLGSAAAGGITLKTLLGFVLIVAFTVHANSINDYTDRDIDEVNLKDATDRPLVSKDISDNQFWVIHFGSGLIALLLSLAYGWRGFMLTLAILFIDYIYSLRPIRITDRTILSPLLLAAAYVYYSFSLGFWSASVAPAYPWLLTLGLFFGFIARLLLKDFRDVKGDKQHGKITFLLRYGAKTTCFFSGLFWLLAMVVVAASLSFPIGTIIPLALGVLMALIWLQKLSVVRDSKVQEGLVATIAKSANVAIITILAYLLCRNQASLSSLATELIPAVIGTVLLASNWVDYVSPKQQVHVRAN